MIYSGQAAYLSKISLIIPAKAQYEDSVEFDDKETWYSKEELEYAENAQTVSRGIFIALSDEVVASVASVGIDGWSFLSSIQILSFLILLQLYLPLMLEQLLSELLIDNFKQNG